MKNHVLCICLLLFARLCFSNTEDDICIRLIDASLSSIYPQDSKNAFYEKMNPLIEYCEKYIKPNCTTQDMESAIQGFNGVPIQLSDQCTIELNSLEDMLIKYSLLGYI